jgi:hypothetical protein
MDVVFNLTRAVPIPPRDPDAQANLPAFLRWDAAEQERVPPNVLRFRVDPDLHEREGIPITSAREHLELVKIVLRDREHRALQVYAPDPDCPSRHSLRNVPDINEAIGSSFGAREYLKSLDRAIDDLPSTDPLKAPRRFFYRFDLHTNPLIWDNLERQGERLGDWLDPDLVPDANEVESAIGSWIDGLEARVAERVQQYPAVPHFAPYEKGSAERSEIELLSELQLQLDDGYSLHELGTAFELFANGELRLNLDNLAIASQPSSGAYFLFGEFALLAMGNRTSTRSWKNRSRFLLRTQPVFAKNYAPDPVPANPVFSTYASKNYCGSKVRKRKLDSLEREYASLSAAELAEKATRNAHDFLGGL